MLDNNVILSIDARGRSRHDGLGTGPNEHERVATPAGYGPVAPWIISKNTAAELAFLTAVFGASEKPGSRIMDGDRINHVEIDLAGAVVLLFDSFPDWAPTPAHMRVYVADVERTLADATARGARVVTEPVELAFGDIVARFRDPQAHLEQECSHGWTSVVSLGNEAALTGLPGPAAESLAFVVETFTKLAVR